MVERRVVGHAQVAPKPHERLIQDRLPCRAHLGGRSGMG
jgi:hypothetical protein